MTIIPVVYGETIDSIQKAWDDYNKLNSEYTYCIEEGGDTDITKQEVDQAWKNVDDLIKSMS